MKGWMSGVVGQLTTDGEVTQVADVAEQLHDWLTLIRGGEESITFRIYIFSNPIQGSFGLTKKQAELEHQRRPCS